MDINDKLGEMILSSNDKKLIKTYLEFKSLSITRLNVTMDRIKPFFISKKRWKKRKNQILNIIG